ncbi:MAG TPA: hypothetical protein VFS43_24165 [Polyangiaceae bacterium]|nr:hypothetical protein [Polyangiaceae bacterium]
MALAACGDDDDDGAQGRAGSAGAGGTGGTGGTGGSGGTGGTGGAGGTGGTGGGGGASGAGGSSTPCADAFDACVADDLCNKIFSCVSNCALQGSEPAEALPKCLAAAGGQPLPMPGLALLGCAGKCDPGGAGAGGAAGAAGSAGASGAGGAQATCPDASTAFVKSCSGGGPEQSAVFACFCQN